MGFTPPLAQWMRGPLKDYVMHYLSEQRIKSQDILSYPVIDRIKRDFYELNYDKAAKKIWNILMFEMWYEKWMS
jgi:asparagine synthase (glutamine-hydrolysing)